MARGDHIKTKRRGGLYSHHGIDLGDGTVVHFSGEPLRREGAKVCRTDMETFLQGSPLQIVSYAPEVAVLPVEETLRLAEEQIGREDYSLFRNNCEHFAAYCKTGRPCSKQVRMFFSAASAAALVALTTAGALVGARLLGKGGRTA